MNPQSESISSYLDELGADHGRKLKDIAITSIRSELSGMRYRPRVRDSKLKEKSGIFVTLKKLGELRGCIGFVYPTYEMWDATMKAAIHAAFSDPRFRPVQKRELEYLEIEISVLGPLEKIKSGNDRDLNILKIGNEGLMVVGQGSSGLLLPQVATELNLNAREFLEETCLKAGLLEDAWKDPYVDVYRFPAKIF